MFDESDRVQALKARLTAFMEAQVYPNEATFQDQLGEGDRWAVPPIMEALKAKARKEGLWNLFLPAHEHEGGLTNLEYAPLCEIMGRSLIAPEIFNCNAPDTGNMETLLKYGTEAQKARWLPPLLEGRMRSAFCMTEPAVASSDAKNIETRITRDGDDYVINGRKWWNTGAGHPDCELLIVMGISNPEADANHRHAMILVPRATPGVTVLRHLSVYGYDHAPRGHMEVDFKDVRVPADSLLLGEGRGFEIAQGRLGPGRIHHCMRLIGTAERAIEAMCARANSRVAFHRTLAEQGTVREDIALSRIAVDQAQLMTLHTARRIDEVGAKAARAEIAAIKVAVPRMACEVIDRAIQIHGGAGVSGDFFLAAAWSQSRTTRLADGPDAVHLRTIAQLELAKRAG